VTYTASIRAPSSLNVARQRAVNDPRIRPGTKFLYDFCNPFCHPGRKITPGAAPIGTAFTSLTKDRVLAQLAGAAWTINADGSLQLPGNGASFLNIGAVGAYDMAPAEYEYVACVWFKPHPTDYVTAPYTPLLQLSSGNANFAQALIDMGNDGLKPRGAIGVNGTSSTGVGLANDIVPGNVMQLAVHYKTGLFEFYANGALAGSGSGGSVPNDLQSAANAFYRLMGGLKGSAYRMFHTDIAGSITTEKAWGLADDKILTAAQYIARDYAFCTGTLPNTPKTPFA